MLWVMACQLPATISYGIQCQSAKPILLLTHVHDPWATTAMTLARITSAISIWARVMRVWRRRSRRWNVEGVILIIIRVR